MTLKSSFTISGLYYKHVTIVNYASSGVYKLTASINDDARVVIYDRHMFIVQANVFIIHAAGVILLAPVCLILSRKIEILK